ncbi:MAG: hypothetical protein H0T51_16395 [Pirellulales bacterium]|nr:hypothetical protein [Pirellulales bacterium]
MPTFVLHPDHPTGEFRRTVQVRGEMRLIKFSVGVPVDVTREEAAGLARDVERGFLLRDGAKPAPKEKPEPPKLDPREAARDENFDPILPEVARGGWWPVSLNWSLWRR